MKNKRPVFLLVLTIVFSCLFLVFAVNFVSALIDRHRAVTGDVELSSEINSRSMGNTMEFEGKSYHRRDKISTVLFLGVDYGNESSTNMGSGPHSDTMILFILDDEARTIQALMISRDTMTEVDLYDTKGEYSFSSVMQITMQYTFGDSPARACFLTKRTVSELLYDTRIDSCLALYLNGLIPIVDGMGGLTLTMPDDYTYIDSRYQKDAVVTLSGEDAERFVRNRDSDDFGSNNVRMDRQFQLVKELFHTLRNKGGASYMEDMIASWSDYIESDLDAETLQKFAEYTFLDEPLRLPGKDVEGERHDEFYVNDAELQRLLLSLFYEER